MKRRASSRMFHLPVDEDESKRREDMEHCKKRGIVEALNGGHAEQRGNSLTQFDLRLGLRRYHWIDKQKDPREMLGAHQHLMKVEQHMYLKPCFLCKKGIVMQEQDVYMYRCKVFCSTDCREKQVNHDEHFKVAAVGA